jgi:DNA repair protein RecO (recombination protein O)
LRAGALLSTPYALYALTHLAGLARLLPERDPHESVFEALEEILDGLTHPALTAARVVKFELEMLAELGFGLDLASCAATGTLKDLVYVSPKSGRAVSRAAGEPWHDRLLPIPAFLSEEQTRLPSETELSQGFALTGYFLERRVVEPRGQALPDARAHFVAAILRTQAA